MKRIVTLLLALALLLSIAGCSSDASGPASNNSNQSNHSTEPSKPSDSSNQPTHSTEASKPSEQLIAQDLEQSLAKYRAESNSYAVDCHEFSIDKSLTEEKTYTAQISVTAKSRYALLYYTVNVAYTLYDQGWSMDSCEWEMINYEVVEYPINDTSILPEIEFANNLDNQSFDCDGDLFSISGTQVTTWSPYATGTEYTTMIWKYDISDDRWDDYSTTHSNTEYALTSKFADAWSNRVSNVSKTGFDVFVNNALVETETYHVYFSKGELSSDQEEITLTYVNNDIEFYLEDEKCTQDGKLIVTVTLLKTPEKVDNQHLGEFTYDMMITYTIINLGPYGYDIYPQAEYHKI